ncbi:MAG: putative metal-dependent hydrolase [Bradymonadia bacterium]|jgi:predicted metal-dependent hydrolase
MLIDSPIASTAVTVGETRIPYTVRVSTRAQRMRLVVKPDPKTNTVIVELVAPKRTPHARIAEFANLKRRWSFSAVGEVEARQSRQFTQRYAHGSTLQYRGRWHALNATPTDSAGVRIAFDDDFDVQVPAAPTGEARTQAIARALDLWLKGRALNDIERLGDEYASMMGVEAAGYRLTNAKRRWGSCASNGIIRVHWRLVQAPLAAMEYVVAHEITHLIHRHHQPPFWQALAGVMPDLQTRRASLKAWETAPRAV